MAGYLANNLLPARAGELVRSYLISRGSPLSNTYVLTTALAERLANVIALVLWTSLILMGIHPQPAWMAGLARSLALVAGAGAMAIAALPYSGGLLKAVLLRVPLPARLRRLLLDFSGQILQGLAAFHHWGRFLAFTLMTIAIWLGDAAGIMVGASGLGLRVTFPVAMLLLAGMGLGSALPSTPGYVGIYQFAGVTILTPFGVSRNGALAFTLVIQVIGYLVVLLFGLPGLARARYHSSPCPRR